MNLLISDEKKIEILEVLPDGKVYTFYHLSKAVRTNYETVKKNCGFLELLDLVKINRVDKENSASGVASYRVKITQDGLKILKNVLKSKNPL